MLVSLCLFFRQGERSEGGDADPTNQQIHTSDQSPQAKEPPCELSELSPPAIPEGKKEENEMEQDQVKPQLSSSVIIDMPNVHSSLELSTITGTAGTGGLWFSHSINWRGISPSFALQSQERQAFILWTVFVFSCGSGICLSLLFI